MSTRHHVLIMGGIALFASGIHAQEQEPPTSFTYATYYYCDVTGQERVDELFRQHDAPYREQLVKEGKLNSWGWLAHHTGGKWRRVEYYSAPTVAALLDAQNAIQSQGESRDPAIDKEFGTICNGHDDYIWEAKSSSPPAKRGPAGFSVYYDCDELREERADEIWARDFAPILNRYVEEGKFTSWGWQAHHVGGKFRRLQTMTAGDMKSLMAARDQLIDDMYPEDGKAGEEFTDICGSHVDYMWEIQLEGVAE